MYRIKAKKKKTHSNLKYIFKFVSGAPSLYSEQYITFLPFPPYTTLCGRFKKHFEILSLIFIIL